MPIDYERIKELVSKYDQIKKSDKIKNYNEEQTKQDFILPLFEALGWNVYNRDKRNDSISAEETISKKRVDYGFRISGIPKFFLEAKPLRETNIENNMEYVTQAIDNQDKHLTQEEVDEAVQRILDRLIFIRNAEDRELEENRLQSHVRQWASRGKGQLVKEISKIYSYFDDQYNSKLFAKHLSDDLYLDNEVLLEVIEGLNHSKDNSYRYDFSIIEADVLGNIYEQYLGNILKSTPKRAKLSESKTHRKEQGIYYTPSYIVDYIVKNTVGEYIKTHTPDEIRKVRILDPACGSGSFLIRAYKELENYWKANSDFAQLTLDSEEFYSKKVEILKKNIFGVDLDPKAVEIAQLNLLLQISERKQRLPLLQSNIKVGNSLIDDPSVSDKAFKWEEEFPEVMKEGGFDIIIGNPPYFNVKSDDVLKNSRVYSEISNGVVNSASLFMQRGKLLLRDSGYLGYIVPKSFLIVDSWGTIRNNLLKTRFICIKDVGVAFEDVGLEQVVFVNQNVQDNASQVRIDAQDGTSFQIPQSFFEERHLILTSINPDLLKIIKKIERNTIKLGEISEMPRGITVKSSEYESIRTQTNIQVLGGTNVERYLIKNGNKRKPNRFIPIHDKKLLSKKSVFIPNRIIYQNIVSSVPKIVATLDKTGMPTDDTLNNLLIKNDQFNYSYILGILNSDLMTFYLRYAIINNSTLTVHLDKPYLGLIPIKNVSPEKQIAISNLVNEFLTTYIDISKEDGLSSDKAMRLKNKAKSIEDKLNSTINDLYRINAQEDELIKKLIP